MLKKLLTVLSPAQLVSAAYLLVVLITGVLLMLPVSWKPGVSISPLDALFTSVSAISVTGLTTVSTADTFSGFGVAVLLVAFQFGAIGIMTLGSFYWMLMGQHIGLLQRKLIMIDQNRNNLAGLVDLMRLVLILTLAIELIGTVLFAGYFYLSGFTASIGRAFYYGLFHSVSAFTNAGFDLFGDSFVRYSGSYYIQALSMLLIVSGAVGFPVLAELWRFARNGEGEAVPVLLVHEADARDACRAALRRGGQHLADGGGAFLRRDVRRQANHERAVSLGHVAQRRAHDDRRLDAASGDAAAGFRAHVHRGQPVQRRGRRTNDDSCGYLRHHHHDLQGRACAESVRTFIQPRGRDEELRFLHIVAAAGSCGRLRAVDVGEA